jgi:hypothetical protein
MTINTFNANAVTLVALDRDAAYGGAARERVPSHMPLFIPSEQAYYWTFEWQKDIRESMGALEDGDYVNFDSGDPNDVARWFLSGRD